MEKYKLLRPHNGQRDGEVIELSDDQVSYFQRIGLIAVKEQKEQVNNKIEKSKTTTKKK